MTGTGTSSTTHYYAVTIQNNSIYVAPKGAAYMLVRMDSNDDPAKEIEASISESFMIPATVSGTVNS